MNNDNLLLNFVEVLKQNGFKVYTSSKETEKMTYIFYVKDNKIGYCQEAYFGGLTFSTVHKPCKNFGTGFGLYDYNEPGNYNPTIEDAEKAFMFAPRWANGDTSSIKKYSSWDDYIKQPINQILKYIEL